MLVTPEVSQLDMSALKFRNSQKSSFMSVTSETHQSAIGPYVAMAEAASESNAWTAAFREALLVKVFLPVQATSGRLGDGGGGDGKGDGGGGEGEGEGGGGLGDDDGGLGGGGLGDGGGDGGGNMQIHCLYEEHEPELRPPKT